MGMAASQARYLALTARKTNVEYEGQQINQERTALSNQSANTFNDLLTLEVPTAPSTQDYTEIVYSYDEGMEKETITGMSKLENDPDGYNYLITHYHYSDVYTGIQNKLANPQVAIGDTSTKTTLDKSRIDTVQESTYTVNGSRVSAYDQNNVTQRTEYNQIVQDYPELADIDSSNIRYYIDSDNVIHFTTISDLKGSGDAKGYTYNPTTQATSAQLIARSSIDETKPTGDVTYTVDGNVVSKYNSADAAQKKALDQLAKDYPAIAEDTDNLRCYTDSSGTVHFVTQATLEGKGDYGDYYSATGVPTFVGTAAVTRYNPNDANQKSAYDQILKDFPDSKMATSDPNDIYTWTYQKQTRFATLADLREAAASGPDSTQPTENQNKLTYYIAQNVNTKIERTEKARVDLGESGRPESIQLEDSSATYSLSTETSTDENAYQDAMNQYNYDMAVYEKRIEDINAKTKKIQEQDRTLELRLRQLDTEQEALQTEMEAVKKVIEKNIESTFKTFE